MMVANHVMLSERSRTRSVFVARPGSLPQRVADRSDGVPPVVPIVATYVAGWAVLSALFTVVGLLLTEILLDTSFGDRDAAVNRWLAERRTDAIDGVTSVATFMANTVQVIAVAALACLLLLVLRHWREAVFLAGALLLEVTVFLTANTLADRPRPDVFRLDSTPSTGSFPSGHAAATLALWGGLAIIVNDNVRHRVIGVLSWIVAVLLALLAAFSRVYRGMHHATDVVAGLALGTGALAVSLLAVQVVSAVVDDRRHRSSTEPTPARASELTTEVAG